VADEGRFQAAPGRGAALGISRVVYHQPNGFAGLIIGSRRSSGSRPNPCGRFLDQLVGIGLVVAQ